MSALNRSLVQTIRYAKQKQLYLHQVSKTLTKISFSENPDKLHFGVLKPHLIGHDLSGVIVTPDNFQENREFLPVLQQLVKNHVAEDQTYIVDAMNYPGSHMAIGDFKVILDFMNQRPEMPNTLGFIRVDNDMQMDTESYEPNDLYTLCNIDGVITLSDYMNEKIHDYI